MRKISIDNYIRQGKPPLVMFLVCLISFALVLCAFIVYVRTHDLHNPDEIDWNIFREKMASLDYCVKYPTQSDSVLPATSTYSPGNEKKNSYFYDLTFDVDYWGPLNELKNLKSLEGKIDGFFIGKEKEILDIKFQINNIRKNPANTCDKRIIQDKECHEYLISGCVSLTASTRIFPKSQAPESCKFRDSKLLFSNQTAEFVVYKETPDLPYSYWCPATFGAKSIIKNTKDPSLTVLINEKDKNLICRNLMSLVIFLSVLIIFNAICIVVGFDKNKSSQFVYSPVIDM